MFGQCIYQFCNRRCFLTDGYIDTIYRRACLIETLLVDDGIHCDGSLTGLTVTDDQLTLSTSDREHGVDRQDTGLHRNTDRFSLNNTRCFSFYRIVVVFFYSSLSVDRLAQRVDNSADKSFTDRDSGFLFRTYHTGTFFDSCIFTEQDTSDGILTDILNHSFFAVFKSYDLAVHRMIDSIDRCDSVTDTDNLTGFLFLTHGIVIFDFLFQNGNNFF